MVVELSLKTEATMGEQLYTLNAAAVELGLKPSTLYSAIEREEIPHMRAGSVILVKLEDVKAWHAKRQERLNKRGFQPKPPKK